MEDRSQYTFLEFTSGPEFDSIVSTRDQTDSGNLTCKIRLKVFFNPIEMKSGPATGYYQEEDDRFGNYCWDRMLWESWKQEYKRVLEEYWSGKFWLITPEGYEALNYGGLKPNIRCDLMVEPLPFGGGSQHRFNVTRVADYRVNRCFSGGPGFTGWLGDVNRGSDADSETKLLAFKDVEHLLVLPHLDRQHANLNKYFKRQPLVATGGGGLHRMVDAGGLRDVSASVRDPQDWNARPWQLAMNRHTNVDPEKWKVMMRHVPPQQVKR